MKVTLELDCEQVDDIIRQDMRFQYKTLKESLDNIDAVRMFDADFEADQVQIKKMMKAMKRVYSWYAGSGKDISNDD